LDSRYFSLGGIDEMINDHDKPLKAMHLSQELGALLEWRKWSVEIPYIRWPSNWHVKAIPPWTGAIVRYNVLDVHGSKISIYLDCYDILGSFGEPYWNIFPDDDGGASRYAMNDLKGLIGGMRKSFKSQKKLLTKP
jgi:hypothetical protein